ncbi:hypothetical protein AHAS_Ahas09G0224900 [Arachis hypogaea]
MNPWNPCDDLYFQISSSSADYSSLPIIQTSPSAVEDHHHHQILVHGYEYDPAMVDASASILDIVLRQGLNVVDCTSITTDDHRFIHTIRSEDPQVMTTETDYTELQRKLKEAISSSSN